MEKQEIFLKFNNIESEFLSGILHQEGGPMTRAALRNVDAEIITFGCIVFKNRDGKYIVVPFNFKGRVFPSAYEVSENFMDKVIEPLVKRHPSLTEDEKAAMIDLKDEWLSQRVANPENAKKIAQYNSLKTELEEKGLI